MAMSIQGERDICEEFRRIRTEEKQKKNSFFDVKSRNDNENKGSASLLNSRTRIKVMKTRGFMKITRKLAINI